MRPNTVSVAGVDQARRAPVTAALSRALTAVLLSACAATPAASTATPAAAAQVTPDPDAWRLTEPTIGSPRNVAYPSTQVDSLPNGMSLRLITRQAPTLSLGLVCKAGSNYDPPGKAGVSALTARLLTEGTQTRSAEALAIATEELGAHLIADSSEDSVGLQLEVLPTDLETALPLLAEVLLRPRFAKSDFERVQKEWLDSLLAQREETGALARLLARRALLGPDAGENPAGNPKQVAALTRADIRAFHHSALSLGRCAVLAVGNISADQLKRAAGHALGGAKSAALDLPRRAPRWPSASRVLFIDRADAVQTSVYFAAQAPSRSSDGHDARRVVDKLFGGLFTSRINTNLRENHAYTYGAFSGLSVNNDYGVFAIQTDVKAEVTLDALEQLFQERKQLQDAKRLQAAEIARAKTDLIHKNAANLEHTASLFGALRAEFSQDLPVGYFQGLEARVSALDATQVQRQLAAFQADVNVLALVGPKAALNAQTSWHGVPIEVVDAAWLDQP